MEGEAIGLANQNNGGPSSGDVDGDVIGFSALAFGGASPTAFITNEIAITDDVVIDGTALGIIGGGGGAPITITLDAAGLSRIFHIDTSAAAGTDATVTLTMIGLKNGTSATDGGALFIAPNSPVNVLTGTVIDSCKAVNGGAITNEGSLRVHEATFSNNTASGASGSGGAIFNATGGVLSITDAMFSNNTANRAGGAIEDQAGAGLTTTIAGTTFLSNNAGVAPAAAAPGNGGAIHITGASDMTITGGLAEMNVAAREGGGYWNGTGTMSLQSTVIRRNAAYGDGADDGGGGIFNNGGTLSIVDTTISNNIANGTSGSGGGIFSTDGEITISGTTIIASNEANRAGGGIEVIDGKLDMTDTTLGGVTDAEGNVAGSGGSANPGNGGGLHVSGTCTVSVNGGSIQKNVAASEGGGLWNQVGATMTVAGDAKVVENTARGDAADNGGGGLFNNGGTLTITGAVIANNVADGAAGSGGGLFSTDGLVTVSGTTMISANEANRAGGGIEVIDGTLHLMGTTLGGSLAADGNIAGSPGSASPGNGGGLHVTGSCAVNVIGGTVQFNVAAKEGGGLWNQAGATMTVSDDALIQDNAARGDAADDGGGGLFNNGGTLNITGATISNNVAEGTSGSGGGLFSTDGTITITGTTLFTNNKANRAGGGIEVVHGSLMMTGTTLGGPNPADGNVAGPTGSANPGSGGGLHVSGTCGVTLSGGTVQQNVAAREGGGLWNQTGATMTLADGVVVRENTASGAAVDDGGGGIFNNGGTLTITGATISSNVADGSAGSGGGIFSTDGIVSITGATIIQANEANRAGGGIEVINGTLSLTGTTLGGILPVDGNVAGPVGSASPGNGGGIHVSGSCLVTLTGGTVQSNLAAREGGGLWNQTGATMLLTDNVLVDGNTASGDAADDGGGGIFNNGGILTITEATISNNRADGASGSGGGILTVGGTVTVTSGTITGNIAHRAGGGIEDASGSGLGLTLTDSTLDGNNAGGSLGTAAPGSGGGLHITGPGVVNVTGGSVSGNTAYSEGGGLWNGTGTLTVDGTSIANNTARGDDATQGGGGLFNAGGQLIVKNNASVTGNRATGLAGSGGGLFNDVGSTLTVTDTTITNNEANRAGGGIEDNVGTLVELTRVTLSTNTAGPGGTANPGNGGGFHVTGAGTLNVADSVIDSNTAANEGGGLWNSGAATMTVTTSTLSNNAADDGGGLFQQAGGGLLFVENATISSNNAINGGGVHTEGGTTTITQTTVAANTGGTGGGINVLAGTVSLLNTVVGDNSASASPDVNGPLATSSHSLIEDLTGTSGFTAGSDGNLAETDPALAPLADNGGASQTHLPMSTSPLLEAGSDAVAASILTDQRGTGFPRVIGNHVDIGAVEAMVLVYDDWAETAFTAATPEDQRQPDDNPDGDDSTNAFEYLNGTDPESGNDEAVQGTYDGSQFILSYDRLRLIPPGVDQPQVSDDLMDWDLLMNPDRMVTPIDGGTDRITIAIPVNVGDLRQFAQIILLGLEG